MQGILQRGVDDGILRASYKGVIVVMLGVDGPRIYLTSVQNSDVSS